MKKFKPRVVGLIIVKNGIACQSYKFSKHHPVGSIEKTSQYYLDWGVDEIIIINIDGKMIDLKHLRKNIKNINIPVCYGGGITNITDAKKLLDIGIDKISLNNLAINQTEKIDKFVNLFGSQFVCASIDLKKINSSYYIYCSKQKKILKKNPYKLINLLKKIGVGEIMFKSVDLDGTKKGYDKNIVKKFGNKTQLPFLISGGSNLNIETINLALKFKFNPILGNVLLHHENSVVFLKEAVFNKMGFKRPNNFFN